MSILFKANSPVSLVILFDSSSVTMPKKILLIRAVDRAPVAQFNFSCIFITFIMFLNAEHIGLCYFWSKSGDSESPSWPRSCKLDSTPCRRRTWSREICREKDLRVYSALPSSSPCKCCLWSTSQGSRWCYLTVFWRWNPYRVQGIPVPTILSRLSPTSCRLGLWMVDCLLHFGFAIPDVFFPGVSTLSFWLWVVLTSLHVPANPWNCLCALLQRVVRQLTPCWEASIQCP